MGIYQPVSEIVKSLYRPAKKEIIPTGLVPLDEMLDGGFGKQEMVVIGGSTGVGKSFLAGQMAYSMARGGFSVFYLSLELSAEMVVSRIAGSIAGIKPTRILWGTLSGEEQERKEAALANVAILGNLLKVSDSLYEWDKIVAALRGNKPEIVFVDFVQNVIVPGRNDEYDRLSFLSISFQKLAKELNTCIVLLSQLSNRVVREGEDARYLEYKGAGTIAQVADLGFWLLPDSSEEGRLVLALRKNRRGPSYKKIALKMLNPSGRIVVQ